jgi:MFS family permease
MLYAIPLVAFLRDDRSSTAGLKERPGSPLASLRALLTNPSFLLLVLYFTLPAMAAWIVRDWMPAILRKRFELGEGFAGVAATLPWQLAAIGGAAAGGYLADRWSRTNSRARIYVSAIGVGLIAPAIFGVGNSGMLWVAVLFLILFGLGWGFFDCNNMPILAQIVRPNLRATGYGIMNFVSISCGGLADWGFGRLEDLKTPLNVSFGIFACVALLSIVTVLLIRPRPELATEKSPA